MKWTLSVVIHLALFSRVFFFVFFCHYLVVSFGFFFVLCSPIFLSFPLSVSGEAIELNRQINNLAPHKDGADIAKYIRKLEADLEDLGCPSTRFNSVLFQKKQSKTGSSIVASLDRTSTTYICPAKRDSYRCIRL